MTGDGTASYGDGETQTGIWMPTGFGGHYCTAPFKAAQSIQFSQTGYTQMQVQVGAYLLNGDGTKSYRKANVAMVP